jgi:hypothetical protein
MKRKLLIICIFQIILTHLLNLYISSSNYNIDVKLLIVSIFSICVLFFSVFLLSRLYGSFFNLFTFYYFVFYLFNLGQSIPYVFNLDVQGFSIYKFVTAEVILEAKIFTINCLNYLLLGAIISFKRIEKLEFDFKENVSIRIVGILLFIVSIIPTIDLFYRLYVSFSSFGYREAFESISGTTSWNKLSLFLSYFFIPAIFMLYISAKNKKIKIIMSLVIITYALFYFSFGDRTYPISILIAWIWLLTSSRLNNLKAKDYFIYITFILVIVIAIPAIGTLRNNEEFSIASLLSYIIDYENFLIPIVTTFSIMGYSLFPLTQTMLIVPTLQNYSYGLTYWHSLLTIFPNLIGGVHPSAEIAGLSSWLMKFLNLSYGPGYSFPAEAWYNFGSFGYLFMFFIGYVFNKILNGKKSRIGLFTSSVFSFLLLLVLGEKCCL